MSSVSGFSRTAAVALAVSVWFGAALADSGAKGWVCREAQAGFLAAPNSVEGRQYAPEWRVDVRHLKLEVTPDFAHRTVSGTATWRFVPIAEPLRELRLDAVDLAISNVTASASLRAWQVEKDGVRLTFDPPLPPEQEAEIQFSYAAEPEGGLYFRTPELGYRPEDTHLFTQGEAIWARHWFPCFDAPNERFTSEIICHVPADMVVLSNGRRVSREVDEATGLATVHWAQEKPHVNYLIALAVGHFVGIEDRWRDVPLSFFTPHSQAAWARNSFRDTRDIMAFFEREIGVLYPWDKYAQVCVQDFVAGGMENTSLTILTDRTLFPTETGNLRSSQGLVAHEMAHQWFGDYVTCKDWSHLWLNEGFATYYEKLYDQHKNGRDSFLYKMFHDADRVLSQTNDQTPIVNRTYAKPDEQFSFRAYPKGGWVLHMLRSQLGETLYRRGIRAYLERHALGNVTTDDLRRALEEVSGRALDAFFDQWVYHAGTPVLEVDYGWDEAARLARVSVKQTQKLSSQVLLFRFPLTFRFQGDGFVEDRRVTIRRAAEDFYFALPGAPKIVRVDPDYTVLAQVKFTPPRPLLLAQLDDDTDMLGRLFAVQTLAQRKDGATVKRLGRVLREDPFYGVRIETAKALRRIRTDAARKALLAAVEQPDARVTRQVLSALRGFYTDDVLAALRTVVDDNPNPDLRREAIAGLAPYPTTETTELLRRLLREPSFGNVVANAAIQTLRAQDDPASVAPLLELLQTRRPDFRTGDFGSALRALAHLDRHATNRAPVREFLQTATRSPNRRVRQAALAALGELADPRAIPVLETFADGGDPDDAEVKAARKSLEDLRAGRKPDAQLGDLRHEVRDLRDTNQKLRDDLDALKKRFEAVARERTGRR